MTCSCCAGPAECCLPPDIKSLQKWRSDFNSLRNQWSDYAVNEMSNCKKCQCCCGQKSSCLNDCSKLSKGKFGLAWIAETDNKKCFLPTGWQLEICDTPSRVESECNKMMEWVNPPPSEEHCCNGCCPQRKLQPTGCCRNKVPHCAARLMPPSRCYCQQPDRTSCESSNKKSCSFKDSCCLSPCTLVPICMVQGGDVTNGGGTGGESIYGDKFEDENFVVTHDSPGILGMSHKGPNTNSSQFYITTGPCPHLDGLNVAFGIVRKGLNILVEMAEIPRSGDRPKEPILIVDCGEFRPGEKWNVGEKDETKDIYPPFPEDWDLEYEKEHNGVIEEAIYRIKESGNYFFEKENLSDSERKYKKALRYINWYIGLNVNYNKKRVNRLRINSLLNLAAVRLKKEKYKETVELCDEVIRRDFENGKAHYRRAQARLGLLDYDKAILDLNKALHLFPNDKKILALLDIVKQDKLSYLIKERQTYRKMFK